MNDSPRTGLTIENYYQIPKYAIASGASHRVWSMDLQQIRRGGNTQITTGAQLVTAVYMVVSGVYIRI